MEVTIHYENGSEITEVSRVATNCYRLKYHPPLVFLAQSESDLEKLPRYGDLIEARQLAFNSLQFVRVLERAPLDTAEFLLTAEVAASPELEVILKRVVARKGHWQRMFHGVLSVFWPSTAGYNPTHDIMALGPCGKIA